MNVAAEADGVVRLGSRLWFGPLAAVILLVGVLGLATLLPGYSQVRQTVSEIGEIGSPARVSFAAMLCAVAACLLVFASAVHDLSRARGWSIWAAAFVGFMAVPVAGVGIFAYPHPLHNVFGLLELVGYQAPLVLALTWRRDPDARRVVAFSWIMALLVWVAIALNLVTFARGSAVWDLVAPVYGLVQRGLFAAWFVWCAGAGLMMRRLTPPAAAWR